MVSRKTKKTTKTLSLGGLRKALEHIKVSARTKSIPEFQKEYKKVFHRELTAKQAKQYVQSLKASQRGGMADLQYDMRPGADVPNVSVPPYLTGGFGFANVNSTIGQAAGTTNYGSPGPDQGSNLVGGRGRKGKKSKTRKTQRKNKLKGGGFIDEVRSNLSQMAYRPFAAVGPPSIGNDAQLLSHGHAGFPSPRPEIHSASFPTTAMAHSMVISGASKVV
jgi:hypothetical protein